MSAAQIEAATTTCQAVVLRTPMATRSLATSFRAEDKKPSHQASPSVDDLKEPVPFDERLLFKWPSQPRSLDERLFDNAAALKIDFAHIAMHLSSEWRQVVFKQLDRLLDPQNWEHDSAFVERAPFMTFLRFVIYAAPTRFPSLGVSPKGHILAAWLCPPQQIAVEFLEADKAAATFSIQTARSKEIIAWRGHVADLKGFIQRNNLSTCLGI